MSNFVDTQSEPYKQFSEDVAAVSSKEQKIEKTIAFMKESLARANSLFFRDFWRAQKVAKSLFKEDLPARSRAIYWQEYCELLAQAHALQKLREEEQGFAIEQITLALSVIKKEISSGYPKGDSNVPLPSKRISQFQDEYGRLAAEAKWLSHLASRVIELRKEVIALDIRMGKKNQLLTAVAEAGDQIFPRRKELVGIISKQFVSEVEDFVQKHFHLSSQKVISKESLFQIRKDIQELQKVAKGFALQAEAFRMTRKLLVQAWDILGKREEETASLREEFHKKKAEQGQTLIAKIKEEKDTIDSEERAKEFSSEIYAILKTAPVDQESMKQIKQLLKEVFDRIYEAQKKAIASELAMEIAIEEKKMLHLTRATEELEKLVNSFEAERAEEIKETSEELLEDVLKARITEKQKLDFQYLYWRLQEQFMEQVLSPLVDQKEVDSEILDQAIEDCSSMRDRLKNFIQAVKKEMKVNSLDIESAMKLGEYHEQTRNLLEKIDLFRNYCYTIL